MKQSSRLWFLINQQMGWYILTEINTNDDVCFKRLNI